MIAFVARRAGSAFFTIWIAATLAFVALRILPGDPILEQYAQSGLPESKIAEMVANRRSELGLDQPIAIQYAVTIVGLLHGDLGHSLVSNRPVSQIIAEQIGPTVILAVGGLGIAIIFGIGLGILTATTSVPWVRRAGLTLAAIVLAAPIYWTGTLAITIFSVGLRLLPSAGSDDLSGLILPWLVLGFSVSGSIARVTMSSLDDTREADFVRTARAKGLPERRVTRDHILRASLGPIVTVIALQAGFLLGGAVVTEAIFVRPGLGQVLLSAIGNKDFAVVEGIVVLNAIVYSVLNMSADMLTAALDPRVRAISYEVR